MWNLIYKYKHTFLPTYQKIRAQFTNTKKWEPKIRHEPLTERPLITNILPTNDYLKRYKIKDDDTCEKCQNESDTIIHRLYDCELIGLHLVNIQNFLKTECNKSYEVSMIEFLFGKIGERFLALNHAILELKKLLFYSTKECVSSQDFPELFFVKIKSLIIKEKMIALQHDNYECFSNKWNDFTCIYDFRGPDTEIF